MQAQEGRVLCLWGDAGWGRAVQQGKREGRFADELVEATAELITERWELPERPEWVTAVPSLRRTQLVPDFAERLANRLGLPFLPVLRKVMETPAQKGMQNSVQQERNARAGFGRDGDCPAGPVLLVDDIVDSRWTLTVCSELLRQGGSGKVYPVALASAAGGGDSD